VAEASLPLGPPPQGVRSEDLKKNKANKNGEPAGAFYEISTPTS